MADVGLFDPLWSEGVAAEWLHVTDRRGDRSAVQVLAKMNARWPEAMCPPGDPGLLDLPDRHDRHVLAAAIAGEAECLCTLNLRDFPVRTLAVHGLVAISPDDLAMQLWLHQADAVEAQVSRVWPTLDARPLRNALKRARLPRLGKAVETVRASGT